MSPKLEQLANALAPLVADRLAELLAEREQLAAEPLIDAAEVARRLGIERGTVYALADELGAIRLGDGPKPRLKFDPRRVAAYLTADEQPKPSKRNGNGRRRPTAELLPIKGARPR